MRRAHPDSSETRDLMSEHDGGARKAVSLTDLATRVPAVLADLPVIARGVMTGLLPQPNSKRSIGTMTSSLALASPRSGEAAAGGTAGGTAPPFTLTEVAPI